MVRWTFSTKNAFLVRFVFNFIKLLDICFQDVIINLISIYIIKYNKRKEEMTMSEQTKVSMSVLDGTPLTISPDERVLVNSNLRMTIFCVEELRRVFLKSNLSITKVEYALRSLDGETILAGEKVFEEQPKYDYSLSEVLPLDEMVQYERSEPPFYLLSVDTTVESGKVLKGAYSWAGSLVQGYETTVCPWTNMKERLAAIPMARPDMTEDELRQICVDFIDLQSEFPYMLPYEVNGYVSSQKKDRILRTGIVHAGTPYITVGSGSLYRIAEFYDEKTGMISEDADYLKNARLFGNACSGSAAIAWSRVVNSAQLGYTMHMCASRGCIPLGDIKYDFSIQGFVSKKKNPDGWSCRRVCDENGEQVMFEAYALTKPADGAVNDGHVRMFTKRPTVVRNEDGTINGDESYVIMGEQVCYTANPNHIRIAPDGSHYIAQGCVNIKYSFKNLFDTGYIPYTFAELIGTKKVDLAEVWVSEKKDEYTAENIASLTVSGNYNVSDVFLNVTDDAGNVVYKYVYRSLEFFYRNIDLSKVLPEAVKEKLAELKGNTLSIDVQLYNGAKLNALTTVIA